MKFKILSSLLIFSLFVNAQIIPSGASCSYYGEEVADEISTYSSTADARKAVQRILDVVGLRPNFEIRAANVPNAAAVIFKGQRYILYNTKFMRAINSAAKTDWAGISILAHEVGHHLNGHTLTNQGSRPDLELEADEFSGFILRKLGASLENAQKAMSIAADKKSSHTHPARKDRLVAIATGWRHADDQARGKEPTEEKTDKNIKKPVIVENPEIESVPIAEKYISYDVK